MTNEKAEQAILVLMRHAARDFSDDGLSEEGLRQASTLGGTLHARGFPEPAIIESSPKRRTRATLKSYAEATGQSIAINRELDERARDESVQDFETRVKNFCQKITKWAEGVNDSNERSEAAPRARVVCSHLDWLEAIALFLPSDDNDLERCEPWTPMAIRVYRFQDGVWRRQQ